MPEFITNNINELVFICCGVVGGIMHYLKKFTSKETDATLLGWYSTNNVAATVYTLFVFTFMMIGAVAAGVVNEHTDVWAAMYIGFTTGFAVDAGFNGDMKKQTKQLVEQKKDLAELIKKEK